MIRFSVRGASPARALIGLLAITPALGAPASAGAAATMTNPANGAKVALDRYGYPSFAWTLPAGEVNPEVEVGDAPTYDPETLAPFSGVCVSPGPSATSCKAGAAMAAGSHYAFIWTRNADQTQNEFSPTTTFVVPPLLTWFDDPRITQSPIVTSGISHGVGPDVAGLAVNGWINVVGGRVDFAFTVKHGRRVVKRSHDTQTSRGPDDSVSSGVNFSPIRGIRTGTPLTVMIVMRAAGISLTRTATMKAP